MSIGFVGEYTYSVDDKGRLTIPARLRHAFNPGIILTVGLDHCLWGFTREGWERFAAKLASLPSGSANARTITRFFFSQAFEGTLDRQGRVLIPENLRRYANLANEAVIAGVGDRIEIWSPEAWQAFKEEQMANLVAIAEELGDFGI